MNTKPLKILYHHRTQGRGAEGVHISSIVNALTEMGHYVKVISPSGIDPMTNVGSAPVDKSNVETKGIHSIWKFISKNTPNFIFEIAEILYNLLAMRYLEAELKDSNYDFIYERYAFFMLAGGVKAKKYNIPFILEVNEVSGIQDRARKQIFKKLCTKFEHHLFKNCYSIHTVSSYLKNMIIKQGVPSNTIHVTPNAIDPKKFTGCTNSNKLIEKYDLRDKVVIGFAGWFDDWDRLDLLIEVFGKLYQNNNNLRLILIGDGAILDSLRNKVEILELRNCVILTGAVARDKVQKYISLMDIAVITHSNEFGSPVVMFEFMGLKIPIVAPRIMPVTDVLEHNATALLFDVLNMKQLQLYLEQLINDMVLRKNLSTNAYELLMQDYTWEKNAQKIIRSSGLK